MNYLIHPTYIIHTGDVIDQYIKDPPSFSDPSPEQWALFNSIVDQSKISRKLLIYCLGNHDQWGLLSPTSSLNYAFQNTNIDPNNYYINSHEKDGVRVLLWTPYRFPSVYGPESYINKIKTAALDALEKALQMPTNASITIVGNHNPSSLLRPMEKTSKTKLNLKNLLKRYNVEAFLNGHEHPPHWNFIHYGIVPEITAVATKSHNGYGLLTFDNGRLNYQYYSTTSQFSEKPRKLAVLTHPAPLKLQKHIFPDRSFDIRALCFSNSSEKCSITAEGFGDLVEQRQIKDGVYLYSLHAEFESGIHKLKLTGDIEEEIEFAVDCSVGPFREHYFSLFTAYGFPIGWIFMCILVAWIIVFSWIPPKLLPFLQETENWLHGQYEAVIDSSSQAIKKTSNLVSWITVILGGPMLIGGRIYSLPCWLKILFLLFFLWSFALPICFFKVENKIGVMWSYGYIVDGKAIQDLMCSIFGLIWEGYLFVWTIWFSFLSFSWNLSWIVDILATAFMICVIYAVWVLYGADYATKGYAATSFEFVIFPIFMIGITIYLIIHKGKAVKVGNAGQIDQQFPENQKNETKNEEETPREIPSEEYKVPL